MKISLDLCSSSAQACCSSPLLNHLSHQQSLRTAPQQQHDAVSNELKRIGIPPLKVSLKTRKEKALFFAPPQTSRPSQRSCNALIPCWKSECRATLSKQSELRNGRKNEKRAKGGGNRSWFSGKNREEILGRNLFSSPLFTVFIHNYNE